MALSKAVSSLVTDTKGEHGTLYPCIKQHEITELWEQN